MNYNCYIHRSKLWPMHPTAGLKNGSRKGVPAIQRTPLIKYLIKEHHKADMECIYLQKRLETTEIYSKGLERSLKLRVDETPLSEKQMLISSQERNSNTTYEEAMEAFRTKLIAQENEIQTLEANKEQIDTIRIKYWSLRNNLDYIRKEKAKLKFERDAITRVLCLQDAQEANNV